MPSPSSVSAARSASIPTSTSTKFVALPDSGSSPRAWSIADEGARSPRGLRSGVLRPPPRRRGSRARRPARLPRRRSPRWTFRIAADEGRRPDAVADPEARQPVELRERPQREHVVSCPHEIGDRVEPAGGLEIVEVRLVDHRQDVLRELADEGDQIVACRHPPGRVVRRCDEEQPGAWRDRRSHRRRGRPDRRASGTVTDDGVALLGVADEARERRPGHDDLVARLEDGLADVADHGVGARGHDDLLARHAVALGERGDELVRAAARIAVQTGAASVAIASSADGNGPLSPSLSPSEATPAARPAPDHPRGS